MVVKVKFDHLRLESKGFKSYFEFFKTTRLDQYLYFGTEVSYGI